MNRSSLTNLTILIKKLARKSSIGRKITTRKQQRHATTKIKNTDVKDQDVVSVSTCSSNEDNPIDIPSSKITSDSKIEQWGTAPQEEMVNTTAENKTTVWIRDFGYPDSSPLHYGKQPPNDNVSNISLSSERFNGRHAKALFDFIPETKDEVAMKCGQVIWIQDRQCPGWLIADVDDETGLVPESYIEFV
ncbi:hypothetical protein BC941DRAFT_435258 [Chlamydoabsidia padenii]|nr:hypothetical protein BC941DRAFT_435258 [Chlamydoabsidia padenii]